MIHLQAEDADHGEHGSARCGTGDLLDDDQSGELEGGHPIGSHRRLLPGVFGRGVIPFRIGYPARGGRVGNRGGLGRGNVEDA